MKIWKLLISLLLVLTISGCGDKEKFTVSFDKSYNVSISDIIVNEGGVINQPVDPEREGHTFVGWYTDLELTMEYDFSTKINEDFKLYTNWTPLKFTLSFDTNGGNTIILLRQDYGTDITMPEDPIKEGYVFMGWYNEDFTISYETTLDTLTMGSSNKTFYAMWEEVQFTITFETNGGSLIDSVTSVAGDVFNVDDPVKEGEVFSGWYYDEELTIPAYIATMPEENITLYAKYDLYSTITFYTSGGYYIEPITMKVGTAIDIPVPVPFTDDFIFSGWYLDSELSIFSDIDSVPEEDITLYAKWTSAPESIRWSIEHEPWSLDPGMTGSYSDGDIINHLFEGLTREVGGVVYPGIATSWETSVDGLTMTFHLRESEWSDGSDLTAHDFVYSWLRAMDSTNQSEYSWIWEYTNIVGAMDFVTGVGTSQAVGIEALDNYTLEVTFYSPTPYFESLVSFFHFKPVKQSAVELSPLYWWNNDSIFVGNGPYNLTNSYNGGLDLTANSFYWDSQNIQIDTIEVFYMDSPTDAFYFFNNGDINVTGDIPSVEINNLLFTSEEFHVFPMLGTYYYSFNLDKDKSGTNTDFQTDGIWANENLRKALSYSINRDEIVLALSYAHIPALGFISPDFMEHNGLDFSLQSGSFGIASDDSMYAEAVTLFALAADEMGMTITELQDHITENEELLFNTSEGHLLIAEMIQEMWSENLGFTIPIANQEWAIFDITRADGDFSIARSGWLSDYMDPAGMLNIFEAGSYYNHSNYYSPEFNELMDLALSATTNEDRFNYLYQAYEIFMNDMPVIPIYHFSDYILVNQRITGWGRSVLGTIDFTRATFID